MKEKEEEGKVGEEEGVSKLVPSTQCGICGAGAAPRAWEKSAPVLKCTSTPREGLRAKNAATTIVIPKKKR